MFLYGNLCQAWFYIWQMVRQRRKSISKYANYWDCGPLGAKDQKPTSQNKVPPVMHLGLQDGRDREGERERGKWEWAWKNKRPSVGRLLQSAVSVTEFYFEEEEVGGFASTCHTAVVCSLDSIKLSVEYAEIKHLPWIIRL
jgi:hypothetical protein